MKVKEFHQGHLSIYGKEDILMGSVYALQTIVKLCGLKQKALYFLSQFCGGLGSAELLLLWVKVAESVVTWTCD